MVGLVIYGCIRDSHELKTVNIGCKALGSIPRKSAKAGSGNISVQVGGITVKPGSYVYCDLWYSPRFAAVHRCRKMENLK